MSDMELGPGGRSTDGPNMSTACQRYDKLVADRTFYLESGQNSARLTIPSVFPSNVDQGRYTSPVDDPSPWQSFGGYATEALASKFLLTSFPPSSSFFRYEVAEKDIQAALDVSEDSSEVENLRLEIQKALASRERAINKEFETGTYRVGLSEVFRHLLITGNVLVNIPKEGGGIKVFHLGQYVVRRGPMGRVLELVLRETYDWQGLPDSIKDLASMSTSAPVMDDEEKVDVYTHIRLEKKSHVIYQEAFEQEVPGTRSKVKEEKSPWLALRFTQISGESYGRGFIETYRGALNSLNVLRRSIVENSAAAARTVFMVRPNGSTRVRTLASAPNGGYVVGAADDVSVLRMDKQADLAIAKDTAGELIRELSSAFLMSASIRRDAERVTAEEIRAMARELEGASGGAWSVLAHELQLPVVKRIESILERKGDISPLPGNSVQPVVITGLEAIGRTQELQTLREVLSDLSAAAQLSPEIVEFIDPADLAHKILIGHGIPTDTILKTKEEVLAQRQAQQQEMQRQALMSQATKAVPGVIGEGASLAMKGMSEADGGDIPAQ